MTTRSGFTLIEVLIAVGITAAIGAVTVASFNTTIQSKEILEQAAERDRAIASAMSRMVREIGAAYVSDRFDSRRYRDQNDRPTNFIGLKEKLTFSSMSHQRLYADAKESDQQVLAYQVRPSRDPAAHGRLDLVRRANPVLDEKFGYGGSEDVMVEGVKRLAFQYWDAPNQKWETEWDTRRLERRSKLPVRVRITLFVDENDKEVALTTQARVMMDVELRRYQ